MATSAISISNDALLLIGGNSITSFSDGTREAEVASALYSDTYESLLVTNWWTFSLYQRQLAQETDSPLFGYQYAYALPSDLIRLKSVRYNHKYRIYQDKLYSDNNEVYINYQFTPNEGKLPAHFVQALKFELASLFAIAIGEDTSKAQLYEGKARSWAGRARTLVSFLCALSVHVL